MKYHIILIDIARKYIRPEILRCYIDQAAELGYNQLQLYFSDNQGFRLALDDMRVKTDMGQYDVAQALGDGYTDLELDMTPDGSGRTYVQSEIKQLIDYAADRGVEIVPAINTPGHMGAILDKFPQFCYRNGQGISRSSLDITNPEACAFAYGLLEKYLSFFELCGCRYFNLVADEFALDLSGMDGLYRDGDYPAFMAYLQTAVSQVLKHHMIPRVFNDSLYMDDSVLSELDRRVEVCYCFHCCSSAERIMEKGHGLINGTIDLFWVLGKPAWQVNAEKISHFVPETFVDKSTINRPEGVMLCIWCDRGDAASDEAMYEDTLPVLKKLAQILTQS